MCIRDRNKSEPLFINVEIMPLWKSCALDSISMAEQKKCSDESLLSFVYDNLEYPREACIEATVIVRFTIQKNGKVSNFKFLREYPEPLTKEVKKVFDKMPDWIPGTQRGIPVDVNYTMPIKFTLS